MTDTPVTAYPDRGYLRTSDLFVVQSAEGGGYRVQASAILTRAQNGGFGVGTDTPMAPLHVVGGMCVTGGTQATPTGAALMDFANGGTRFISYGTTAALAGFEWIVSGAGAAGSTTAMKLDGARNLFTGADGVGSLGLPGARWAGANLASSPIVTSDANLKKYIGDVPDAWLGAWGEVPVRRFKYKGGTRWHVGRIAQEVRDAFTARDIDAGEIGLFCRDELEDGTERLSLRYDECAQLEAAWQRRELARLRAMLEAA